MRARTATTALLAIGALLAACTGTPGTATDTSPSVAPTTTAPTSPTAEPTATATETPDATARDTPSPTQGGPLGDARECENEELGYEVDYPGEWWANERIDPEDDNLDPIAACQFFATEQVELQPNAGLPNGIAIRFEIPEQDIDPNEGGDVISDDETTIDGREARVVELEPEPQAGFVPEGSRMYRYVVEIDDGRQLMATTDNILQDDARYDEAKPILDAMMDTLEIDD